MVQLHTSGWYNIRWDFTKSERYKKSGRYMILACDVTPGVRSVVRDQYNLSPFTPILSLNMYSYICYGARGLILSRDGGAMLKIINMIYLQMSSFTVLTYMPSTVPQSKWYNCTTTKLKQ